MNFLSLKKDTPSCCNDFGKQMFSPVVSASRKMLYTIISAALQIFKKRGKRITGLFLLTLSMVLSIGTPAFADNGCSGDLCLGRGVIQPPVRRPNYKNRWSGSYVFLGNDPAPYRVLSPYETVFTNSDECSLTVTGEWVNLNIIVTGDGERNGQTVICVPGSIILISITICTSWSKMLSHQVLKRPLRLMIFITMIFNGHH